MSKMSFNYIVILVLVISAGLGGFGCGWFSPNEPTTADHTSVTTSVNFPGQSLSVMAVSRIDLVVFGAGVDTIKTQLTLNGTRATGQVSVPVNKTLTFQVTVYDANNVILLQGQTVTTVSKDQANSIAVTLQFQVPALILTPTQASIAVGDSIEVMLQARNVSNMTSLGARILFDQTRLQVVDLDIDPDFISGNDGELVLLPVDQDFTTGKVDIVMGVVPASSSVSGDGILGKVLFKTLVADTVDLDISLDSTTDSDLGMYNSTAQSVDALTLGNRLIIQ